MLQWTGAQDNNNGQIRLSVRKAAQYLGGSVNAAARAFDQLQAKGIIVLTEHGNKGNNGRPTSPAYELTEYPLSHSNQARRHYTHWSEGHDFPVHKAPALNPKGKNGND
ncbi:hypothetical protein [Ruegeria arenilitoris]|uniref:hypothetical protein n=1 Tax=Ruegeria arenilitoris TaxID=1173585 RepID=UPI003C7AE49B